MQLQVLARNVTQVCGIARNECHKFSSLWRARICIVKNSCEYHNLHGMLAPGLRCPPRCPPRATCTRRVGAQARGQPLALTCGCLGALLQVKFPLSWTGLPSAVSP